VAQDLLEALNSATKEDLEAIRKRIDETEGLLASLRGLYRLLSTRFGEKEERPPKPQRQTMTVPQEGDFALNEKRRKVAMYLVANGPKSQTKLSEVTGIARTGPGCISKVVAHAWFHVDPQGVVSVTAVGEDAIRKVA